MKCNFYPKQSFAKAEDKDVGLCDKGRDIWGLRQRSSREEEEKRIKVNEFFDQLLECGGGIETGVWQRKCFIN